MRGLFLDGSFVNGDRLALRSWSAWRFLPVRDENGRLLRRKN